MQNYRKIFSEGLNADDDFSVIGKGQWVNASNIRTFTTDKGATGRIEAVGGTAQLFNHQNQTVDTDLIVIGDTTTGQVRFSGNYPTGTIINVYLGLIEDLLAEILIGTYVTVDGDTNTEIIAGLDTSMTSIGIATLIGPAGPYLLYHFDNTVYSFKRTDIILPGINQCIGACESDAQKRIIFFNYNSTGNHSIYCYDKTTGITYTLLLEADVEGGLQFDKYSRINTDCKIVGDLLIWTDFLNEPRKLNIESAIATYLSGYVSDYIYQLPLKYTTLTLIKRPPIFPLSVAKAEDTGYLNNFIRNKAYQFTYFYRYKDNETSALSAYSRLMPTNFESENSNSISVTLPFTEKIDDDVFGVDVCVKYGNTGETFIIKSFDKDKDQVAISVHNAGTTALAFTFYDDIAGAALSDVQAVNNFDLVPLKSKTLELAKNRLHHAHILTGYDTPIATSLALSLGSADSGGGGTFTAAWKYFELLAVDSGGGFGVYERYYYAWYPSLSPQAYLFNAHQSGTPPASVDTSDADQTGYTEEDLARIVMVSPRTPGFHFASYPYNSVSNGSLTFSDTFLTLDLVEIVDIQTSQFFKSSSTYSVSIAFYDRYRRKCGVVDVTNKITIPERTYSQASFVTVINWTLNNADRLNEIPYWAYYYQIHITKNLTTRFFVQGVTAGVEYVSKDADGLYVYGGTVFNKDTTYALALNISTLSALGLGYSFTEGDLARVYTAVSPEINYPARIIGTDGKYVLLAPKDIGTVSATDNIMFELYTPYRMSINEFYYETGGVFPIDDPATVNRAYSALSGSINGDCFAVERELESTAVYITETMNPNDLVWQTWDTDRGWPNAIDKIGQKLLTGGQVFSDTYIDGSKVNGLGKDQPLNDANIDRENGSIQKLQLAGKTQADGSVLLAICQTQTVSRYLGQSELFDAQGSSSIVKSTNTLSDGTALKGSMGTSNPESVFEYNGQVWWWDTRNGCAVQYSNNGLFPISKNKFVRPANLFSRKFTLLSGFEIEDLGSIPFIIGGFDPYHKEALFSIPATEEPPKGYLEDYVSPELPKIYPCDIYDGQGKTLMYKHDADVWMGAMSFETEMFVKMDNDLYSFKLGDLYIHNQDNTANFYGVQYTAKIMYSNNPGAIHTFLSIGLESNKKPAFVHLRTEDPYTQSSDLLASDFVSREGVIEASLFRDRLSPNQIGDYNKKLITGDRLFGKALLVMLEYEFVNDSKKLELRISDIGQKTNVGTLINK